MEEKEDSWELSEHLEVDENEDDRKIDEDEEFLEKPIEIEEDEILLK